MPRNLLLAGSICLMLCPALRGQTPSTLLPQTDPSTVPNRNAYAPDAEPHIQVRNPAERTNRPYVSRNAYGDVSFDDSTLGSTYISMDSWIYHALARLPGLGDLDSVFDGMRL